jgi:hypothetical protein
VKRSAHLQAGVGAEQHPSGIEQIQMRARNFGPQLPVNVRPLPSSDPAQDVRDARLRSRETRNIASSNTEAIETVKQI